MCLSKVYRASNGDKDLLMEEITSVSTDGDKLLFKTLFGEQKEIQAHIKEIDFMTHAIVLVNLEEGGA